MTSDVITVEPDTPLKLAARMMVRNRVSGLPVVEDGRLCGMVTEGDFLRLEVERGVLRDDPVDRTPVTEVETVAKAMSRGPVSVGPHMTLAEAARTMTVQDVKRLPVVDETGELLGIISRLDIVMAFSRPDEVIEDEIREDLIRRVMFVDPDSIEVHVRQGVVTFRGEIGTRNEARLLEELTARLDGVMRVENDLRWRHDDQE
jgi:CBS domain-containing protein